MKSSKTTTGSAGRAAVRAAAMATATAGTILLSASLAGATTQIEVLSTGGSDELVAPPALACDDVVFVTEASFDSAGNPVGSPRFGSRSDLVSVHDVPFAAEAGIAVLSEVRTYDGHIGRAEQIGQWSQPSEQVYFQFLLDGVVQGETQLTPDVSDGQRSAWVTADMGSIVLENGADTLRIVHSGDTSQPNSVVVSGVCGRLDPLPPPVTTTVPVATTVPEPAVAPPTTNPPKVVVTPLTTSPPATTIPVEVLPAVEVAEPALALTGSEDVALAALGLTLIASGAAAMAAGRRIEDVRRNLVTRTMSGGG